MRRVTTLALIAVIAVVAASCTGEAATPGPSEAPLETLTPIETPEELPIEPPLGEPSGSDEPFPTEQPPEEPSPSDELLPSEQPLPSEPPLITPPPGTSIAATECSDSAAEQGFWARVVVEMEWDVYCPGLPAGWHIGDAGGRWRSSGTGFLEIAYEGPSGALLELREGAFCATSDGCAPPGSNAGAASFGDLAGTLIAGSDGSFAIVAEPGADASYLLVGQSIDEATFRALAAGLTRVEP